MANPDVAAQIEAFVRKRFEIAADDPEFSSDIHLFDYGYVDSFGAQELIAFVEKTFEVTIADDDLVKFPMNTVNEIAKFVIRRKAGDA